MLLTEKHKSGLQEEPSQQKGTCIKKGKKYINSQEHKLLVRSMVGIERDTTEVSRGLSQREFRIDSCNHCTAFEGFGRKNKNVRFGF